MRRSSPSKLRDKVPPIFPDLMKSDLINLLYYFKTNTHNLSKMDQLIVKLLEKYMSSKGFRKLDPESLLNSMSFEHFLKPKEKEKIDVYYQENLRLPTEHQSLVYQSLSRGKSLISLANEDKLAVLPPEIWCDILSHLNNKELDDASYSCKFFLPYGKHQALRHVVAARTAVNYCRPLLDNNNLPVCATQKIDGARDCIALTKNTIAVATQHCIKIIDIEPDYSFKERHELKFKNYPRHPKLIKISNQLLAITGNVYYSSLFSGEYSYIQILDWQKGKLLKVIKHPGHSVNFAVRNKDNILFTASYFGMVYRWETTNFRRIGKMELINQELGHRDSLLVLEDGRIITRDFDGLYKAWINIWSEEGKHLASFKVKSYSGLCVTPNQKLLAYTLNDQIRITSLEHYGLVKSIEHKDYSPLREIIYVSNDTIATYGRAKNGDSKSIFFLVWDIESGSCISQFNMGKSELGRMKKLADGNIIFLDKKKSALCMLPFQTTKMESEKEPVFSNRM